MPTIHVNRARLYRELGRELCTQGRPVRLQPLTRPTFSVADEQFDELCFEFGIELDEVTSERQLVAKEQGEERAANLSDEAIYRIEVPANRYDLLTTEGLVRTLRAYLTNQLSPVCAAAVGPLSVTVKSAVPAWAPCQHVY